MKGKEPERIRIGSRIVDRLYRKGYTASGFAEQALVVTQILEAIYLVETGEDSLL